MTNQSWHRPARIGRLIAVLASVALAAPVASAMAQTDSVGPPILPPPATVDAPAAEADSVGPPILPPPPADASAAQADTVTPPSPPPVSAADASGNGFDYGDAAIGGGSGVAIVLLGAGGMLAVRRHGHLQHG